MNKIILLLLVLPYASLVVAQSNFKRDSSYLSGLIKPGKNYYIKLSGGQVSFGTGDFLGYSVGLEVSKSIIKKPSVALNKLLLGGELIFENGVKNPVINSQTLELRSFYHVSSTSIWPKLSYYPLKKVVSGFNIQLGPTVGYSYRSKEKQAQLIMDAFGQGTRVSTLSFDNGFTYGYRISTGIEFEISNKILTGIRLDFYNNNKGEINTLAGLKAGIKL